MLLGQASWDERKVHSAFHLTDATAILRVMIAPSHGDIIIRRHHDSGIYSASRAINGIYSAKVVGLTSSLCPLFQMEEEIVLHALRVCLSSKEALCMVRVPNRLVHSQAPQTLGLA
ncbi:hypothetical protein V6N13_148081 [Hibiscus sabdariffa]|uniref:RNase H type-1 domain-containing protein n=1 Tax=Hibiscus sabdariffa TaxID=183260 RepID=A0ABR2TY30_9ROSI